MTPAEYLARALDMTEDAMRPPRPDIRRCWVCGGPYYHAPPCYVMRSECCGKPPLEGQEIDGDGYARCGRCHEWARFEEVSDAPPPKVRPPQRAERDNQNGD